MVTYVNNYTMSKVTKKEAYKLKKEGYCILVYKDGELLREL